MVLLKVLTLPPSPEDEVSVACEEPPVWGPLWPASEVREILDSRLESDRLSSERELG